MAASDKRTAHRVPHHGTLVHREFTLMPDKPEFLRDNLTDLSDGGAGFTSAHRYDEGSLVEARLEIIDWDQFRSEYYLGNPARADEPLVAILRVTTVTPQQDRSFRVGCAFESIDHSHHAALRRYLEHRRSRAS